LDVEALTKQNGVRLFRKFKKKVKTDLPYLSFYKKKPETHIIFFGPTILLSSTCYVQMISDLLEQLVESLLASSTLFQDDNDLFQTCQQLGTSSANTSC
jgi:hypothetical protein